MAILRAMLAVALTLLAGCVAGPKVHTQSLCLNRDLRHSVGMWRREAARRFVNPVVFHGHGGYRKGVWVVCPDDGPPLPVETVARRLRAEYPGRPLILVTCNERGAALYVPGCWYALEGVWCRPDRLYGSSGPRKGVDGAGSVFNFVTDEVGGP